jgi:acyl-ACP thioesterase
LGSIFRKAPSLLTFVFPVFLQPRRSDLDMNQHVNNVKYIGWMMEVSSHEGIHIYFFLP